MKLIRQLVVLGFLIPFLLHAKALSIGEDIPYFYYEDKTGSLTLEQFLNVPKKHLIKSNKALSKGYTKSTFWIKANVDHKAFVGDEYWFEILPIFLDKVEFYYKPNDGVRPWMNRSAGDLNGSGKWDVDYRAPIFILPKTLKGYSIVIKVSTSSSMLLDVKVWEEKEFIVSSLKENSFWNFFFGLFSFAAVVLLVLALVLRKRIFWVSFSAYVVYLNLFCMHGYYEWFFGKSPFHIQHYLTSILFISVFSVALLAFSEMLGLRERFDKIYRVILVLSFLIFSQSALIFFDMYFFSIRFVLVLFFFGSYLILVCYFYSLFKFDFSVLYFLVGLGVMAIMSILFLRISVLNGFDVYPGQRDSFWQVVVSISVIAVMAGAIIKIYKERIFNIERRGLVRELNVERETRFNQRQLVSMISHEFRTSLSIISGAITNLKSLSNLDAQVTKRYERIERANARLIQLTDNCLADDRVSSASLTMSFKTANLSEILLSATRVVNFSDHHNMNVSFNGMEVSLLELPELLIKADDAMLQIALSNVFDNALKYMEEGDVNVEVYEYDNSYFINVIDHGDGIDKGMENEIFEKYRKVTRGDSASKPGVGFGLYVCKQIMLGHDGDVRLLGNSDQGCCFEFRIPKKLD
ncbi:sensor histidine kinase [Marinomonas transparens]|uniref:histidine kinase n=1 Tax=Marinomonas transparens TaxID=2795388 RepID=A0A934JW51_9GAMM|nr:sensor histidine kinase [Marinomonas transparens]MBJ7539357.1 sensor histidine kinase [Marinomonas transparens]